MPYTGNLWLFPDRPLLVLFWAHQKSTEEVEGVKDSLPHESAFVTGTYRPYPVKASTHGKLRNVKLFFVISQHGFEVLADELFEFRIEIVLQGSFHPLVQIHFLLPEIVRQTVRAFGNVLLCGP